MMDTEKLLRAIRGIEKRCAEIREVLCNDETDDGQLSLFDLDTLSPPPPR